jgi:cytochrome d ubiquinol oxidase subunit I
MPIQLFFGHLVGDYVHDDQPVKFAAVEGRWHDEQPAAEVIFAWPDAAHERNRYEISIPVLGSLIASLTTTSKEVGLKDFPRADRPPILITFMAFRVMVGCGILMLLIAWVGSLLAWRNRLAQRRLLLWSIYLSFPLPFIAILTGWFTAEVGRQPWTIYGLLRTADALTPTLTTQAASVSLAIFCLTYVFIFVFGIYYICKLLRRGPASLVSEEAPSALPNRPLSIGASTDTEI